MLLKKNNQKNIDWINPLNIASRIASNYHQNWIFLYSGLNSEVKNSVSYIALFPKNELFLNDLDDLKSHLNADEMWLGYVSYEYKNNLEKYLENKKSIVNLDKIYFANFSLIFEFNHNLQTLTASYENENQLNDVLNFTQKNNQEKGILVKNLSSNFTSNQYLEEISDIKKMIESGDFYQTNLTRKFFGEINLSEDYDFFNIFLDLTKTSPANYSSFIKINDNYIISSSPELFLSIKDNKIVSRPIKGTSARSKDKKQDEENKNKLENSPKEKAENLMIVDLVRNDLSRVCVPQSVKVENLFKINSYSTIHHMSSEIVGEISPEFDNIDLFKSAFPPGSMTGAPKIKAIEVTDKKEQINRGVYSGAIGYFKGFDEANFSVVIRTLICKKQENNTIFEFQVGGAITFDSSEKDELEETFSKAKAISNLLNISEKIRRL